MQNNLRALPKVSRTEPEERTTSHPLASLQLARVDIWLSDRFELFQAVPRMPSASSLSTGPGDVNLDVGFFR